MTTGTQQTINALRALVRKMALFEATGTGITWDELNLAEDLADWYDTKGRKIVAERARAKAETTPVEVDEYVVSVRWGGKDGKWRWLTEAGDGQAASGEERMLVGALSAAAQAAVNFPSVQPR